MGWRSPRGRLVACRAAEAAGRQVVKRLRLVAALGPSGHEGGHGNAVVGRVIEDRITEDRVMDSRIVDRRIMDGRIMDCLIRNGLIRGSSIGSAIVDGKRRTACGSASSRPAREAVWRNSASIIC